MALSLFLSLSVSLSLSLYLSLSLSLSLSLPSVRIPSPEYLQILNNRRSRADPRDDLDVSPGSRMMTRPRASFTI
jgi:hypothetical protein